MMKKKRLPHILAAVALALFVGLGLASDATTPSRCPSCSGRGYTTREAVNADGQVIAIRTTCGSCFGSGR